MSDINLNPDYATVSMAVQDVAMTLMPVVQDYSREVEKRKKHFGKEYYRVVVAYAKNINRLQASHSAQIESVAGEITKLAGEGWQDRREIVALWHQLAVAVTSFSEHPTKKVATLIIDKDNRLQAFSANRIPPGVPKQGVYYSQGVRKNFIVCSERMSIAKLLGLKIHQTRIKGLPASKHRKFIQESIKAFSDDIVAVGQHSADMHDSFMLSTTTPCNGCIPSITVVRPKAVFADSRSGIHYTRDVKFGRVKEILNERGIPLIDLAL